jgi:hypothetical protein
MPACQAREIERSEFSTIEARQKPFERFVLQISSHDPASLCSFGNGPVLSMSELFLCFVVF